MYKKTKISITVDTKKLELLDEYISIINKRRNFKHIKKITRSNVLDDALDNSLMKLQTKALTGGE